MAGAVANPRGRPPASEVAKMVEVARKLGASISIILPPAAAEEPPPPVPPVAA